MLVLAAPVWLAWSRSMSKNRINLLIVIAIAAFGGAAVASPKLDPVTAALKPTMQLLALMDSDHSGKVSKAEFMQFMSSEFDRLDKNEDGELDVRELTQSQYFVHGGVHR
jgi:hypothetical protein